MMQFKIGREEADHHSDDYFDEKKKKNTKQSRRRWREIEALKEQKKMQRELASYDIDAMH